MSYSWMQAFQFDSLKPQRLLSCKTSNAGGMSSESSSPNSANLARALSRYNSIRAVAQANQDRWNHGNQEDCQENISPSPQAVHCKTQPGEFTSAEVGILGANVSQLQSAPHVWWSEDNHNPDLQRQGSESTSSMTTPMGKRADISETILDSPKATRWVPENNGPMSRSLLTQPEANDQMQSFGLLLSDKLWESNPTMVESLLSARYESQNEFGVGINNAHIEDAAALQDRLARIELANDVELQSSHAYTSHYTWPLPTDEEVQARSSPLQHPGSFAENFSPLQSSTMQLQAQYWPQGVANHQSFKSNQYTQTSPQKEHARSASWSAADKNNHLRESGDSTEAMLDKGSR